MATRPINTADLARTILKSTATSLLIAWGIWLAAIVGLYLLLLAIPGISKTEMFHDVEWWYLPMSLVGPWITVSIGTVLTLGGRGQYIIMLLLGVLAVLFGGHLLALTLLAAETVHLLTKTILGGLGILAVLVAVLSFAEAWRRSFISFRVLSLSVAAWLVLCCLLPTTGLIDTRESTPYGTITATLFLIGFLALPFLPLPAAPLALAWNRHR